MIQKIRFSAIQTTSILIGACLVVLFLYIVPVGAAINPLPTPPPAPGSYGIEATKRKAPPTVGATITTPGSGAAFSTSPITVTGICPNDLLVQVFNNGVMVGSVMCKNGSFSMQVSLFAGTNELSAMVYDELDQAGPKSNIATVTYNDLRLTAFGNLVTLTSSYGRRSAPVNNQLDWPLQLSGGAGPYAFSIDWGDSTAAELKSQSLAGLLTVAHTYKKAGIYQMNVKVTDVNGSSAFLQLVAVSSGKVDGAAPVANTDPRTTVTRILWIPAAVAMFLLIPTYWLGRRSQLVSLRNKMLKERDNYEKQNAS